MFLLEHTDTMQVVRISAERMHEIPYIDALLFRVSTGKSPIEDPKDLSLFTQNNVMSALQELSAISSVVQMALDAGAVPHPVTIASHNYIAGHAIEALATFGALSLLATIAEAEG